jgi:hypothetical protein
MAWITPVLVAGCVNTAEPTGPAPEPDPDPEPGELTGSIELVLARTESRQRRAPTSQPNSDLPNP